MVDGQKPQTLQKRLKNKLCFILCQDKAFEDKNELSISKS
jgi:hypothetical protein